MLLAVTLLVSVETQASAEFKKLAKNIGDKRIVFLDELTHGEKEVFQLKSEIVKYLHQHHGFDALVIESGMFDIASLWKSSGAIASNAAGNVFYMYANDPSVQSLLKYIDKQKQSSRPLALAGFDGRLSGELSKQNFVHSLNNSVCQWFPELKTDSRWPRYLELLQQTIERKLGPTKPSIQSWFNQATDKLITQLSSVESVENGYDSPMFYSRLLQGLSAVANNMWKNEVTNAHDIVMGDNLLWLLNSELKDKKIMVWGHFVHVNKKGFTPTGEDNATSHLNKKLKEQSYVIHFAASTGAFNDFVSGKPQVINNANSSAELHLITNNNQVYDYQFFTPEGINSLPTNLNFYGTDYKSKLPANNWQQYWDGLFVLKKVSPSR